MSQRRRSVRRGHPHRGRVFHNRHKGPDPVIVWLDKQKSGKCSFCPERSVTDPFVVEACSVHRKAFIDGKLGKDACISLEEHRLVTDLRKLVDKYQEKLRFEIFSEDERP